MFFQTLQVVLEEGVQHLMRSAGLSQEEVYQRILEEIKNNRREWFSNKVPNLNYVDPACRLGYLYIVAAANSGTFKHILETDDDLNEYVLQLAEDNQQIRLCAFGAGPGTELMAMAKFFNEQQLDHTVYVHFLLLDRVQEWQESWFGIRNQIHLRFQNTYGNVAQWPIIPSGNYIACDVTELARLPNLGNVWDQDIYVLNFVLSEIFRDDPGLRAFISEIAEYAPAGARERRGFIWERRTRAIANDAGLELSPFQESQARIDGDEHADDLGEIYDYMLNDKAFAQMKEQKPN